MICFDSLPTVPKCFGCFPLKFGCYIIAFTTIFSTSMVPSIFAKVQSCYEQDSIITIILYGSTALYIYSIVVSIYFVYGLCRNDSRHPTLTFLFLIVKAMVVTIITAILLLIETPIQKWCPDGFVLGAATTFDLFLQGYCLLIVNSYRIEDENIEEFDDD